MQAPELCPPVDAYILDGAIMAHMLVLILKQLQC